MIGLVFPLTLEYFSWWIALALFAAVGLPILLLGMRSLTGLGPTRKWTTITLRLLVLLLFVLILGGARWTREHKDLDVMVLRDISDSTALVNNYPDSARVTLNEAIDKYLQSVASTDSSQGGKPAQDRIGIISFQDSAMIDAMPNPTLRLEARSIRKAGAGTDPAAAIQLAMATMRKDAMHRILLIWDGNKTQGDLDAAIAAAAAQRIPIDVMPLTYNVENEVLVESFTAPTMKNEKEPFALSLVLKSTNPRPVSGTVTIYRQEQPIDTRKVTLNPAIGGEPSLNPIRVRVPGLEMGGVHQFRATFEADSATATTQPGVTAVVTARPQAGDTLSQNNAGTAFTFVKGRGQTLFVDGTRDGQGFHLMRALAAEGIEIAEKNRIKPTEFPKSLIQLQNYDSIILANVSGHSDGLSREQFAMIKAYVQDMGGGLVTIGGEDTYGAGGWLGAKDIEDILPVNMDIPAQRQIAKGALVLVFHSCEMPDGNYWGEMCGIKATEALSERDEIGVISYGWKGGGGAQWDFPLKEKGDGTAVLAAIKQMAQGDMPDFNDTFDLALNGKNGVGGLKNSNARQKHVIVISDGDPSPPKQSLIDAYNKAQITVSTISVYPHMGDPDGLPPNMKAIAKDLKGKAYGPINANPNQLPQIFIKEATLVRRSLIQESLPPAPPLPVYFKGSSQDFMKGLSGSINGVVGMVLTSRKQSPQIDVAMTVGPNQDPLLAYWQTGLGRVITWTSDAHPKWTAAHVGSPTYSKFWAQMVRAVARPPMSTDFTVTTTQSGGKGKVVVEAINRDNAFLNFLNFGGKVLGPDGQPIDVKVVQTGPGQYEGEFEAKQPGNYVVALNYTGQKSEKGTLTSGVAVNTSPELRDLTSNEGELQQIAQRTGGRVLSPYEVAGANLWSRDGLNRSTSPLPIWDILILILLGMILLDVASRRIAWDYDSIKRMLVTARGAVQSYTQTTRKVENAQTMDALRSARQQAGEDIKTRAEGRRTPTAGDVGHDAGRKFEAGKGVEGDISQVVGGASDKPLPAAPKKPEPKGGAATDTLGGLMAAKRRAQQQIKDKEEGKQ